MERKPKLQDKTNRIMEAPFNPKSALAAGASETETDPVLGSPSQLTLHAIFFFPFHVSFSSTLLSISKGVRAPGYKH